MLEGGGQGGGLLSLPYVPQCAECQGPGAGDAGGRDEAVGGAVGCGGAGGDVVG